MKLLPNPTRSSASSGLNHGIDAAVTVALFLFFGYLLDGWLGTAPWCTVALVLIAAVGLFFRLRAHYEEQMTRLEAERRERVGSAKVPR